MSDNPYASPLTGGGADALAVSENDELAGRFTRFAAAMVDGILMNGITMPVMFATGFFARTQAQQVGFVEQIAMSLFCMAVMLALNGYLLATRGQTIGKLLTKIQIVDAQSGGLLPFLRVCVYRYLWMFPLVFVVALIPGTVDDGLVNVVALIDALFIFGAARRCLHDYIAGSRVVLYKANRQRAT
ncbi:MAG: RDD family protein [Planctomycetes bacterium]|nr:RDD family protein [Planctomycetota bacterium]